MMLEDILKHIRFPLMTQEEFALAMNDPESRILDDNEIIDIFIHLTLADLPQQQQQQQLSTTESSSSETTVMLSTKLRPLAYSSKPRCCLSGPEEVISRFSRVESRWGYSGTSDRVRFSVDRRLFIVGFGLFGSIYGKCEYSVTIQVRTTKFFIFMLVLAWIIRFFF